MSTSKTSSTKPKKITTMFNLLEAKINTLISFIVKNNSSVVQKSTSKKKKSKKKISKKTKSKSKSNPEHLNLSKILKIKQNLSKLKQSIKRNSGLTELKKLKSNISNIMNSKLISYNDKINKIYMYIGLLFKLLTAQLKKDRIHQSTQKTQLTLMNKPVNNKTNSSQSNITENKSNISENKSNISENKSNISENKDNSVGNNSNISENETFTPTRKKTVVVPVTPIVHKHIFTKDFYRKMRLVTLKYIRSKRYSNYI